MHHRQNPHSRSGSTQYNNNTSPPSAKHTTTTVMTSTAAPAATTTTTTTRSSNAKKNSSAVRSQRPSLYHRKSASTQLPHSHHHSNTNNNNSHSRKSSHQSISKLLGPGTGPANWSVRPDDEKLEMATSFLQYCAMCEKQITVPCNSVLYCSESCRRKDSCKPLSASSYTYTMPALTTPPASPPMSPRAIVAPLTPTRSSPRAIPGLARIPTELHDAKSDLDPTEWKPVIYGRHSTNNGSSTSLASSDAWNYLSQFHRDESGLTLPFRRSGHQRSSASLSTLGGGLPPSLIHTPSTTASSVTSNASDYISACPPLSRPLPPRHNPSFSTSAGATKGVELVVPHIVAPAEVSLSSSPAESHDGGLWLKPKTRRAAAPVSSAVLVERTH